MNDILKQPITHKNIKTIQFKESNTNDKFISMVNDNSNFISICQTIDNCFQNNINVSLHNVLTELSSIYENYIFRSSLNPKIIYGEFEEPKKIKHTQQK